MIIQISSASWHVLAFDTVDFKVWQVWHAFAKKRLFGFEPYNCSVLTFFMQHRCIRSGGLGTLPPAAAATGERAGERTGAAHSSSI